MSNGGNDWWSSGSTLELITRAVFWCSKLWWVSGASPGAEARLECTEGLSEALMLNCRRQVKVPKVCRLWNKWMLGFMQK